MSMVKSTLFFCILLITVIDSRAIRDRRQIQSRQTGQDVSNFISSGFNTIRDTVSPAAGYTFDQASQLWNRYKPNINQGINQIGQTWNQYKQQVNQGWNRFSQNFYPSYDYQNYGYNQYGYNPQQYPAYYNMPPNYDGQRAYPTYNTGNQWYQNYGPQQRSNGFVPPINPYQRSAVRRR
ncbi:unnamed protein product [Adineta ricciae]|uniref:Uncharacterized protein n=1 Tax=Adineta ricciae TaxID=249248 RepID=A0A814HZS8_ADIRI|nr:unnamed protein product [Adineta ricciae]